MRNNPIKQLMIAENDNANLLIDTWEYLCQNSSRFRQRACEVVGDTGLTRTGLFMRFVEAGAYESAAMLMPPHKNYALLYANGEVQFGIDEVNGKARYHATGKTIANAICITMIRAILGIGETEGAR